MPVSQVTRALARLASACKARLLHRSTHSLSLTDEGDSFLQHARRLLDTAAELQGALGTLTRSLCAAPAYLARLGTPQSAADLEHHQLLTNTASPGLNHWRWTDAATGRRHELRAQGHTRTDNTAVIVALALSGAGIARIIDLVAQPLVRSGALVPVLAGVFTTDPVPILAVILQERHRLPKVRACIDHLAAWMAAP